MHRSFVYIRNSADYVYQEVININININSPWYLEVYSVEKFVRF